MFAKNKGPVMDNNVLGFVTSLRVNTDVDFVDHVEPLTKEDIIIQTIDYVASNVDQQLPEQYDWRYVYPMDSQTTKIKKKMMILKPDNQYLCGSCWAVATAGVIGDVYVVAGMVNWKPDISQTYPLINYPQAKCRGGNPAVLLNDISIGGIPSKHCVDYSWCSQTLECTTTDSASHFGKDLSALLPKEKGCFFDVNHYIYTLDRRNIRTIVMDPSNPNVKADNVQRLIKEHIFTYGPVIGGFMTFKNFQSGAFAKTNNGVYLEKGDYLKRGPLTFSSINVDGSNLSGGHAVAVIGWGVAKHTKVGNGPNDYADVPYWYCRNSWGTKWGEGGYFKMAMYPYNTIVQFTKTVTVRNPRTGVIQRTGGVLAIKVDKAPIKSDRLPGFKNPPTKLTHNINFYKTDEDKVVQRFTQLEPPEPLNEPLPSKTQTTTTWIIVVVVMVVVIVLVMLK